MDKEHILREQLVELLKGGFAPNVILLREFSFDKAGVILEGLHFSAWILLGHIRDRQQVLLNFIKDPENNSDVWPDAHWPENYHPKTREEWDKEIDKYERELQEVIDWVKNDSTSLFEECSNGKNRSWAAMTILHHTGYHIGQLKAVGRQLGVW